jgi:hypothetical protein
MDEGDPRFANVDLGSLLEDLWHYARGLFKQEKCAAESSVLPGTGTSPEDLVYGALTEFIAKQPNWRPTTPENAYTHLYFFVRKMIRRDFLDLIKDGRAYKRTEIIGARKTRSGVDASPPDDLPDDHDLLAGLVGELNDEEVSRRAHAAVRGDFELEEYLNAVLTEDCTKCSQVAAHLGITLREAKRRRDRLKTRLTPLKRFIEAGRASKSHQA